MPAAADLDAVQFVARGRAQELDAGGGQGAGSQRGAFEKISAIHGVRFNLVNDADKLNLPRVEVEFNLR